MSGRNWAWAAMMVGMLAEMTFAGGVLRDSLGARSMGRGGTNLGYADNGELIHDNPGALVNLEQRELFSVGADLLITDLSYSDADNARTSASDSPFPMGEISYIRRSEDGLWAYGLGVYSVAGFQTKYDLQGPAILGGTQAYKSLGMVAKVLPALSLKLTDRLSLGGTFGVAASHTELEGPYVLQGPNLLQGTPLMLDMQGTGATPTWSVGMQYQLSEVTTIGVAYQSEMRFHQEGSTSVVLPGGATTRYDSTLRTAWPESVGLGMTHRWCDHHTSAADVYWHNWSQAFDQFGLQLRNSSTPGFPDLHEEFPLRWSDTVAVRVGHEYRPNDWQVFRAGYIHHPNPIPTSTLTPYLQATLEHTFSVGYGWRTFADVEVDLAYQFAYSGEKQVGTSGLLGGDFNDSRHQTQVHWIAVSLMRRF